MNNTAIGFRKPCCRTQLTLSWTKNTSKPHNEYPINICAELVRVYVCVCVHAGGKEGDYPLVKSPPCVWSIPLLHRRLKSSQPDHYRFPSLLFRTQTHTDFLSFCVYSPLCITEATASARPTNRRWWGSWWPVQLQSSSNRTSLNLHRVLDWIMWPRIHKGLFHNVIMSHIRLSTWFITVTYAQHLIKEYNIMKNRFVMAD